jgi:hypothetical protein
MPADVARKVAGNMAAALRKFPRYDLGKRSK